MPLGGDPAILKAGVLAIEEDKSDGAVRIDMDEQTRGEIEGEIYDILAHCDDDDLNPIVDLLTASPASVLALSRAYELNRPSHSQYADRIGDEIYRLALEAMSPKERRRPSYAAMVEAVCVKVGIPLSKDGVGRNEGVLINTFAPRHLGSVAPAERRPAIDAMRTAAATASDGLLTSAAWPPFAASMIEIGMLRRSLQPAVPARSASIEHEGSLVIQGDDGLPILFLAEMPQAGDVAWRSLVPDRPMSAALTPVLKAIEPFLAADRLLANGEYVRVGIEGGAAALSRTKATGAMVGSAIGHKGQVPFLPVAAGAVAWPMAVVMLASAYMEQKRLENIERSLDAIASSLAEIARFQQTERRSVLNGSMQYFRMISRSVLAGELDDDVLHAIERQEIDLLRIQDHLFADIEAQLARMATLKNEKWTSGKFLKTLREEQAALERLIDDVMTCIEARACGFQLLCAFPVREMRRQSRFEHIAAAATDLCPDGRIGRSIDAMLRDKLKSIQSIESKAAILGKEDDMFDRVVSFRIRSSAAMEEARHPRDEPPPQTLSFVLRMEGGEPIAFAVA